MSIFNTLESNVRSYCRSFPTVFDKAQGPHLMDENGRRYIDFLSGAGSLNYGHNNPELKKHLIDYLERDGLVHGLDMSSVAKKEFLEAMRSHILFPREMDYKIQFSGPTGTNAVEAAMKLARKVTGRTNIISFTNGFHGVTLGSVAATGNQFYRDGSGAPLQNTSFMPYDGYLGRDVNTIEYIERFLQDGSSGVDLPAAMIVETVQGEGGVNVASMSWLRELSSLCHRFDILLIVDDIQVGCGRTGNFFSFEDASITPDIVVLSKSLSGYGLPFAVVLMKPELDQWNPGEHNGTFRGHNLAFVTAAASIKTYWSNETIAADISKKGFILAEHINGIVKEWTDMKFNSRGRGMIWALDVVDGNLATAISKEAFERGLIIETCGSQGEVLKTLPSLLIEEDVLVEGLSILKESVEVVIDQQDKIEKQRNAS